MKGKERNESKLEGDVVSPGRVDGPGEGLPQKSPSEELPSHCVGTGRRRTRLGSLSSQCLRMQAYEDVLLKTRISP